MQEKIAEILNEARVKIEEATEISIVEEIRVKMLGKKGLITQILRGMGELSKEEKKQIGPAANKAKNEIETLINEKFAKLRSSAKEKRFQLEKIDVTEPGKEFRLGVKHPLTLVIEEVAEIFKSMGYEIVEGPQIDTVFNAFDGLNSPQNHPSRDLTDTFYISQDFCLRPHTSTTEIRTLLTRKPPFKIISPGRCFRCDTPDATHSPMFHQIEG